LKQCLCTAIREEGVGASIVTLISGWIIEFLGTVVVDNTDLNVMDKDMRAYKQVHREMHNSLYMRDNLLLCTRGALKLEKCVWYLVDYTCKEGEWKYNSTVAWETVVSVPGGPDTLIKQKNAYHCKETLDVWSCPTGT
jgi:hypothetical protein